jgi:hypothetical protein
LTRSVVALDIDGVVADARHRLHVLSSGDWRAFFAAANDDPLLAEGAQLAHRLAQDNDIVWITGRPERTRPDTIAWLAGHTLPAPPDGARLLMHPGDERSTREHKLAWTLDLSRSHHLRLVVDDDPTVIDLLEHHQLPVQLATWSPYIDAGGPGQNRR